MLYTLKWLCPFWRAHKKRMMFIVFMGIIGAALHTVTPLMVKNIIDGLKQNLSYEYIIKDILIIMGAGLLGYLVNMAAMTNRAWMNMRIEWEVRQMVFDHILKMDRSFYHKFPVGDILTRLTDDIEDKLSWFACSGVFRFIQAGFTVLAVVIVMFRMDWRLTCWALLPMPFLLGVYIWGGRILEDRFEALQETISNVYNMLDSCFSGVRLIKANCKEESQTRLFSSMAGKQREAQISAARMEAFFSTFFHYAAFMCIVFVFLGGGPRVISGDLSLGKLVAFQFYSAMIVWPVFTISQFFVAGKRASISITRLDTLLNTSCSVVEPATPVPGPSSVSEVSFEKVCYRPSEDAACVLDGVSFSLRAGSRTALVGKIGAGKSILLSLIPRLLDPSSGVVRVNGLDIRKYSIPALRSVIGYVPQEAVMFSDTIKNNILLGRTVPEENFQKALRIAQLEGEIEQFENGLDTKVGTKGATLSGGQKQRISIARALLCRPQILLLDDCTSAMDAGTEDLFWKAWAAESGGALCVAVTHRVKTIAASDMIITLDEGRLVEQGKHDELMALNGVYRQIYERQKLSEELHNKPSA